MAAVDIHEQLKTLIELQAIDKQLYDVRRAREAKPVRIAQLRAAHEAQTQQVKAAEAELKTLQLKRAGMEGDLAAKEGGVKKLQMQLYQVKTNRDYTTLQHEIAGVKADNSVLEEEILTVMEKLDQQQSVVAAARETLKAEAAKLQQAIAVIEREMGELDASIATFQTQRQVMTPRVDPKTLSRYERILDKKEGLGLVPVNVRQEACAGCHMNIPPQTINEIRLKERLIACESCARLLYYPEDETV